MADYNDKRINEDQNNSTSEYQGGSVWNGNSYHGYTPPRGTQYTYSTGSSESSQSTPPEHSQSQYVPYGSSYSPYPTEKPKKPKKERKGVVKKVLLGVLACLVVSAGSIAGFAYLINSGVIRIQQSGSGPAFTIVKNSASNKTVTNTEVTTGELTKQQVAEKVLPSVVCIENYGASQQSTRRNSDRFGFGNDEEDDYGDYTDGSNGGSDVSPTSEGSGIIMTSDGYIITNAHVVAGAKSLKVVTYDGKTYSAKLIGSDSITDLALIKVDATGLKAAEFGSSSDMKVADTVMAIGNPGGLEFNSSVTVGYVSALNREITNSETGYTMKCIQTDAAINPGNSGGALVNMHGQVIGINSSKIVATGYEGLGFAIPIDTAQPIITQLKEYGYVKDRAMLGITGTYIDPMTARFYGLDSGLYVYSITSEYISAAGIQRSDVITKIDGKAITSMNSVTTAIASKKPGDTVTLTVSRASTGKTFTVEVKLVQATGKS
jgi:serine protease Do